MTPPSLLPPPKQPFFYHLSSIIYLLSSLHTPTDGIRLFNNDHLFFFSFISVFLSSNININPTQAQPTSHVEFLSFSSTFFLSFSFLLFIIYILYTSHPYSYLNNSFLFFSSPFFFSPEPPPPVNPSYMYLIHSPLHSTPPPTSLNGPPSGRRRDEWMRCQ